ncbi:hypothetical protein B0H13DRAFT_1627563 [Mycena leptocephala]|nr:hypothetical protein B0H13DRAFT_1627563 [Mycena leptocephala]
MIHLIQSADITYVDLLRQFAPRMHAYMRNQLDVLEEVTAVNPAFPGSAFSSVEFTFGNGPITTRRNIHDVIHGFRAITVLGDFTDCLLVTPSDNLAIRCYPGTTVLIAGSVNDYFFTTVAPGEKRYLFQQFFHSNVQRWIDRGFRSNSLYDEDATEEEKALVEAKLGKRVPFTMKLLSRLHEIHA